MAFGISADKLALSPAEALSYIESKRNRAARTDSSSGGSQSDWDAMNRAVQASFGPSGKKYVGRARPEYKEKVAKEKADKESALKKKEKKLEAERKLREQRDHDRKVKEEQRIYDEKQKEIEHKRKLEIAAGKPKSKYDLQIEDTINLLNTDKLTWDDGDKNVNPVTNREEAERALRQRKIPPTDERIREAIQNKFTAIEAAQKRFGAGRREANAIRLGGGGLGVAADGIGGTQGSKSGFKAGETKTVNGLLYERNEQGQWIPRGYIHL